MTELATDQTEERQRDLHPLGLKVVKALTRNMIRSWKDDFSEASLKLLDDPRKRARRLATAFRGLRDCLTRLRERVELIRTERPKERNSNQS